MSRRDTTRRIARAIADVARQWITDSDSRVSAVRDTLRADNTFTPESVAFAIQQQCAILHEDALISWAGKEPVERVCTVCVLNAGNIPFVGLQDFLAVLLTGHAYVGVVSSRSPFLISAFASDVALESSGLDVSFHTLSDALARADSIIATGADATMTKIQERAYEAGISTSRQLVRGTRTGIAVLSGLEDQADLKLLAGDMLMHDGYGCRSVSIVFSPIGSGLEALSNACSAFRESVPPHPASERTASREVRFLKATRQVFQSGPGFAIIESEPVTRAPGLISFVEFDDIRVVKKWLAENKERIQLVVRSERTPVPQLGVELDAFGTAQTPGLSWCPDRVSTIAFLRGLNATHRE